MFRKFSKSRVIAIIKSLATSPAGTIICNISVFLIIIMIFYGIYLFNLYLINERIVIPPNLDAPEVNAVAQIFLELMGLGVIILLLSCSYFIINEIIKCIYQTKQKLKKDLDEYECNAVSWQK